MHKIYSRPRIRLPKIIINTNRKMKTNKGRKFTRIILILIIAFSTAKLILDAVNEIISDVANKIQIEIDKKGRENIEIPVRKLYRL